MMIIAMVSFCGGCKCVKMAPARFAYYELNNFFGPMAGCPMMYSAFIGIWCLLGSLLCFSTWYLPSFEPRT
jgi:hypothetical protein